MIGAVHQCAIVGCLLGEPNIMQSRREAILAGIGVATAFATGGIGSAAAQQAAMPTYLLFQATVNPQTINQLISLLTKITTNEIYLILATGGGDVMAGITAYNFLRSLPKQLTTHNVSNIDSIGNAIFLAGERRLASAHATFMFHGITRTLPNGTAMTTNQLEELSVANRADETRIGNIIKERTKLNHEQISKFFQEAKTMDASEALASGIVNEVAEFKMSAGAAFIVIGQ
jgi:ATP-dependent protease ClpP protease subunit